ncbi:MAG TPA: hypothetical protein VGM63_05425, partial [Mucilaginibacter sp.]
MYKESTLKFCFFILLGISQVACTESPKKVEVKKLANPNPTSYEFNIPLNQLRDSVVKFFDLDHQMNDTILKTVFIDEILKDHS